MSNSQSGQAGDLESDFALMVNAIPQLAWIARADGWIFWYNARWHDYTGTTLEEMEGWGWKSVHHPRHVDRVVEKFSSAVARGEPWEDLFPLRSATGEFRWFLSRAMPIRNEDGEIVRWFGTNTDVTEQKKNEERQMLLMREIDHRAKNALAVALAAVRLTRAPDAVTYKASVEGRIAALSRVHGLLADSRWDGADLERLLSNELAPFHDPATPRVAVSGPAVKLPPSVAQSLGLIAHELASNASKHGALAGEDGALSVCWKRTGDRLDLTWEEACGRPVTKPDTAGFGSTLLETLVADLDGASLTRDWQPEGLVVGLTVSLSGAPARLAEDEEPQPARPAAPARSREECSVLLVEDEVLTALDMQQQLSKAGFEVIGPAGTIEQAEKHLAARRPDIAVLDSNVRGERSWDLAVRLVRDGVPVIFCTGYERLDGLPAELESCPVVAKPFASDDLISAVDKARNGG